MSAPCLEAGQATTLGRLMRKCEDVLGMAVEIEWALDDAGFKLLQARPLHVAPAQVPDEIWLKHPGLQRPSRRHRLGLRPRRGGQLRMRIKPRRARAIFWSPASPDRP